MANGVVVLGMHRSGTSAVTRLVNMLGVPTPAESDLLPPAFDNPRGHWESRSLVEINDRLLAARGCDWTCPVRFAPGWEEEPAVASLEAEAVAAFRRVVTTGEWVWKDPRNCLLLAFWRRVLGMTPIVILVLRNPLEIVASIQRRDNFERTYCVALWDRYMRVCLDAIRGLPTIVTTYDEVLVDPHAWCERTTPTLATAGITVRAASRTDVEAFVEPDLKHEHVEWNEVARSVELGAAQRALSDSLRRAVGAHDAFDPPRLPPESPRTEELLAERRDALTALRQAVTASSG